MGLVFNDGYFYICGMQKRKKYKRPKGHDLPFSLSMIQGAIGKEYVIKHYGNSKIRTRFPDMSRIIASAKQRTCRNLFKKAVAYAKEVITDPVLKAAWQKRIRRSNGVYNKAVKYFMLIDKRAKERDELLTMRLIYLAMKREDISQGEQGSTESSSKKLIIDNGIMDNVFSSPPCSILKPYRVLEWSSFSKHFPLSIN